MLDPVEFGKAMAAIVRDATAPLLARIEELESRQLEKGPPGDKGEDGRDAEPVEASAVVAELLAGDEIKTLVDLHVAESVAKYFEANPVRHGKDGDSVKGDPGDKGDSIKGDPGQDGVGLAGAMIDRDGQLVVTTTKGEPVKLGIVVGKDGAKGADGTAFEGAELDYDGERGLILRSKSGAEIVKRMPIPLDKGFWREGMACEKADLLTHGGNVWIALVDTSAKPCLESKDWRLFVRKGRDGNDGTNGRNLGPAPPVKLT